MKISTIIERQGIDGLENVHHGVQRREANPLPAFGTTFATGSLHSSLSGVHTKRNLLHGGKHARPVKREAGPEPAFGTTFTSSNHHSSISGLYNHHHRGNPQFPIKHQVVKRDVIPTESDPQEHHDRVERNSDPHSLFGTTFVSSHSGFVPGASQHVPFVGGHQIFIGKREAVPDAEPHFGVGYVTANRYPHPIHLSEIGGHHDGLRPHQLHHLAHNHVNVIRSL